MTKRIAALVLAALLLAGAASAAGASTHTEARHRRQGLRRQVLVHGRRRERVNRMDTMGNEDSTVVPLAERWNGKRWSFVKTPAPVASAGEGGLPYGYFTAVRCTSARSCTATGGSLVEHWNGTAWKLVRA